MSVPSASLIANDFGGTRTIPQHYALLLYVLERYVDRRHGIALEFGVGEGTSTELISRYTDVIGFDSFNGLPEDWREGFPAGSFACPPPLHLLTQQRRVQLNIGLFEDTLPNWAAYNGPQKISLIHIDCDLYSSTKTVFDNIGHMILPGTVICFDEFHGYDGANEHEFKAWTEFVDQSGVRYCSLGVSSEQWACEIV